ncbi:MAG: hypothetical protein J3K34DRAFT_412941 [Monoraphidium minutum]|nr:MAG: hypothetical protein J3K34DRAFT_412941 [Monoraphidium minutum]
MRCEWARPCDLAIPCLLEPETPLTCTCKSALGMNGVSSIRSGCHMLAVSASGKPPPPSASQSASQWLAPPGPRPLHPSPSALPRHPLLNPPAPARHQPRRGSSPAAAMHMPPAAQHATFGKQRRRSTAASSETRASSNAQGRAKQSVAGSEETIRRGRRQRRAGGRHPKSHKLAGATTRSAHGAGSRTLRCEGRQSAPRRPPNRPRPARGAGPARGRGGKAGAWVRAASHKGCGNRAANQALRLVFDVRQLQRRTAVGRPQGRGDIPRCNTQMHTRMRAAQAKPHMQVCTHKRETLTQGAPARQRHPTQFSAGDVREPLRAASPVPTHGGRGAAAERAAKAGRGRSAAASEGRKRGA